MKTTKNDKNITLDTSNIIITNELSKITNECYQLYQIQFLYENELIPEELYRKLKSELNKICTL